VKQRVAHLARVLGSEVSPERELAAVIEAVVGAAERDHAIGVAAAAQPLRDKMRRVDRRSVADQAAT
jgi:hypothetical protein